MNDNIYGTLKIFFFVALPYKPHNHCDTTRVEYARRNLYTAYSVTQEDAADIAREFKEKNNINAESVWQANPVDLFYCS